MKPSSISRFVGITVLLLCLSHSPAFGQGGQETIVGTVTDSSGAALPATQITITNSATGQTRTLVTNGAGDFSTSDLPIGTYTVKGSHAGFKDFVKTQLALNLNDTLRVDLRMDPSSVNETVTVVANTVQVQSDSNEVSSLIDSKQISGLDTNGRSMSGLVTLSPGVTTSNADFYLPTRSGTYSINGGTNISNLFLIDGTEDMDRGSDGSNMSPSPDALSEFKVLTSNYGADYGDSAGGIVSVALKSGTRDFHGGLWEYVRNDDLDANNYFANLAHTTPPELRMNTYGGNFGGPLFIPKVYSKNRSKTFFFVNEEWRKFVIASVVNDTVPTAQEYKGNFSDRSTQIYVPKVGDPVKLAQFAGLGLVPGTPFPGNQIPSSLLDPNVQLFLSAGAIPLPTSGSQFIGNSTTATNVREDIVRLDHSVNDKFALNAHLVHFIANQLESETALIGTLPTTKTPIVNPAWNAAFKGTHIIRPNLINQITFNIEANSGYDGLAGVWKEPAGWNAAGLFANNNPQDVLPNVSVGSPYSGVSFGVNQLPIFAGATEFQERDDLFWTKGAHNLKFGGAYAHYTKDQTSTINVQGASTFNGSYTAGYSSSGTTTVAGNAFADMLLGMQSAYTDSAIKPENHIGQVFAGVYAMDDWRALRGLTLNFGLRWDAMPHGFDKYNQTSNFVPSTYNQSQAAVFTSSGSISPTSPGIQTVSSQPGSNVSLSTVPFYLNGIVLAGRNGLPRGMANNFWSTFEPRVGFAYDLLGNGKTILRSGAGIFFQEISVGDTVNAGPNPPFTDTPTVNNVYFTNPSISTINGQSIGAFPILPVGITSIKVGYPLPGVARWSLGIQQQLNSVSLFTIAYVGASGWHQQTERAIDTVPLSDPNRKAIAAGTYNANLDRIYPGYSGITQQENSTNLNYNSLQATLRVQNHSGDAFHLAYTYSKALGILSGVQSNPFDPSFDYGPTALDQRHVFVADYILAVPLPRSWSNSVVRETLGGWQVTGITYMQSGQPVTPTLGINNLGLGGGTARPNLIKALDYPKTRLAWFDTAAFQIPVFGSFGNASAYSIRLPGRDNWNMALFKTFPLARDGKVNLQFRADAYNTFNHTQFATIQAGFNASNFGQVLTAYDPRVFQLSMRFGF
jgi:hypothetical protein